MKLEKIITFATILIVITIKPLMSQGVKLSIELDKNIYYEGETIYLVTKLTNLTNEPYSYYRFYLAGNLLHLSVKTSSGKQLGYYGVIAEYLGIPNKSLLQPGENVEELIALSSVYPSYIDKNYPLHFPFHVMMLSDTYIVQAEYDNDADTLKSNILTFKVTPPSPPEQRAHDEIKDLFMNLFKEKTSDKTINALKDFIRKFPNSAYISMAKFNLSERFEKLHNLDSAASIKKQLIIDYPDNFVSMCALRELPRNVTAEEKRRICNTIIMKHQNKLGSYARTLLKQLNQQGEK